VVREERCGDASCAVRACTGEDEFKTRRHRRSWCVYNVKRRHGGHAAADRPPRSYKFADCTRPQRRTATAQKLATLGPIIPSKGTRRQEAQAAVVPPQLMGMNDPKQMQDGETGGTNSRAERTTGIWACPTALISAEFSVAYNRLKTFRLKFKKAKTLQCGRKINV